MQLSIRIHTDTKIINEIIDYPTQNKVSFSVDTKDKKIQIKKITLNDIETNIFYNTSFAIDGSDVVIESVHEITKKGVFTLLLDDLYVLSHRSNNWHCSKQKKDFIFKYEFTNSSFVNTYRDRDHIGFEKQFIPCFGCSYTYGAYQPTDASWPSLLRKKTNENYINLGIGGAGIDGIYNNLKLLHKKNKFTKCIILFPNFGRRVVRCKIDNLYFRTYSTINLNDQTSNYHFYTDKNLINKMSKVRHSIVKDVDNRYSKIFLNKIINYCKNNQIELLVSSWDNDVYEYLQRQSDIKIIKKFPDMKLFKERANDGAHPHKKHYQYFIDSF